MANTVCEAFTYCNKENFPQIRIFRQFTEKLNAHAYRLCILHELRKFSFFGNGFIIGFYHAHGIAERLQCFCALLRCLRSQKSLPNRNQARAYSVVQAGFCRKYLALPCQFKHMLRKFFQFARNKLQLLRLPPKLKILLIQTRNV